jgi:hypothetical protein
MLQKYNYRYLLGEMEVTPNKLLSNVINIISIIKLALITGRGQIKEDIIPSFPVQYGLLGNKESRKIISMFLSGDAILPNTDFIKGLDSGDEYVLSTDGRTGVFYRKIKVPSDVLIQLASGIKIGLAVGIPIAYIHMFVRRVVNISFNGKICVTFYYSKDRFLYIMLVPKIAGILYDDRLVSAIRHKKLE